VIILDTDHFMILQVGRGPAYDQLSARIDASPDQDIATTVITFEEHMRGWLAEIRRARDIAELVHPYDQLIKLVRFFHAWDILRFSEESVTQFNNLRRQRIRIGTQDLKIAAIALETNSLLLSANLRDFDRVPGLQVESWLS
jgi:tRNA(fMet)-specific endonuclease VapC